MSVIAGLLAVRGGTTIPMPSVLAPETQRFIEEIEAIRDADESDTSLCGRLGFEPRNLRRWKSGDTEPEESTKDRIRARIREISTGPPRSGSQLTEKQWLMDRRRRDILDAIEGVLKLIHDPDELIQAGRAAIDAANSVGGHSGRGLRSSTRPTRTSP